MSKWLRYPAISVMLLGTWLLLNASVSVGHILIGSLLAIAGALVLVRLDAPALHLKRLHLIVRLFLDVAADMVRSNWRVAKLTLRDKPNRTPGFVRVELGVRSQYGLAVLACIITATPGTSWVAYDPKSNILIMHVLDLSDDDDWREIIKGRYEGRLMEIFE